MTEEEIKALAEKVSSGNATKEEELQLLQELNKGAEALLEAMKKMPSAE